MRNVKEIRKKKLVCLEIVVADKGDENEEYRRDYYAGASNALRWVLEELDEV